MNQNIRKENIVQKYTEKNSIKVNKKKQNSSTHDGFHLSQCIFHSIASTLNANAVFSFREAQQKKKKN